MTMVVGMFTNLMKRYGSFIYVYLIQSYKCSYDYSSYLYIIGYYDKEKQMIRIGTMWYQTYVWAKQYRCSIAYYLIYLLSKLYQSALDIAVDTPGHVKDILDGFNAVPKRDLGTFLRICSTPDWTIMAVSVCVLVP